MQPAEDLDNAARWFLKADDGRSTIRIATGLTLTEDAHGEVELDHRERPDSLVRFEVRDTQLWLVVVGSGWVLADESRSGAMFLLEPETELCLPNNRFLVTDNILGCAPTDPRQVRLERDEAAVPAHVASQVAPPVQAAEPVEAVVPEVAPASERHDRASDQVSSAWRWLMPEPGAATPEAPQAPPRNQVPPESPPPRRQSHRQRTAAAPAGSRRHTSDAAAPGPRALPRRSAPAADLRPSPAGRRAVMRYRRRRTSPGPWVATASAVLALVALLAPPPAQTPMEHEGIFSTRLLASSGEDARPMLEEVEALLQSGGRMNDPASLAFAVEAYRTAVQYGHPDEARLNRLEELEQRLARLRR